MHLHPPFLPRNPVLATFIAPARAPLFGWAALSIGLLVLSGWALGLPQLTSVRQDWPPMVINAAICFALCGAALALQPLVRHAVFARLRQAAAALVLLIAAASILEILLGVSWIDLNHLHASGSPLSKYKGQMPPNAALTFIALGLLLMQAERVNRPWQARLVQTLTALVAAAGAFGMLSFILNLEFLYSDSSLNRMAFLGACGFIALAAGSWCLWRKAPWNLDRSDRIDARQIYRTSAFLSIVIAATVALISFALSQDRSEKIMADQMSLIAKERRLLFESILGARLAQASQISSRPAIITHLRELQSKQGDSRAAAIVPLQASAKSFLAHGFSAFAYTDAGHQPIASAGRFTEEPELSLPLAGLPGVELLWRDGYLLRARLPIRDAQGTAAYIVTEQPLPVLTALQDAAIRHGSTGDMIVCGARAEQLLCFPFRWSKRPAILSANLDGKLLPLSRATRGETSTTITPDFRRQRVMVAFGPVGKTGLGLGVKMDMLELYAPIRQQFFWGLPFLALLVALGAWMMRMRLRPLVHSLDNSRRELVFIAQHDPLTGLPNRMLFNDRLQHAMLRARRANNLMALMYLDLDHFKKVNDTFGHSTGDAVLRWFAAHLLAAVRSSDTVARLGGDEFTIILDNLASPEDATRIAQAILDQVAGSRPAQLDERLPGLSASIGIAYYRGGAATPDELMDGADLALYESKRRGRNRYSVHPSGTD